MLMRTPSSFGVGEVLFSSEFRIAPRELAGWELAQVLDGRDDRSGFRTRLERPPMSGESVPEGLILVRTLEALERSSNLGGCSVSPTSIGKLRSFGAVAVGERLTAVATVRYRSVRAGQSCAFLTLAVEIRGAERKLAEVDIGVEVSPRPLFMSTLAIASQLAQAA